MFKLLFSDMGPTLSDFFKLQDIGINASFVQMRPSSPQASTFPMAAPHAPAANVHVEWLEEGEMNSPLGTENTQQTELREMHRKGAWPLRVTTQRMTPRQLKTSKHQWCIKEFSAFKLKEPCLMYLGIIVVVWTCEANCEANCGSVFVI